MTQDAGRTAGGAVARSAGPMKEVAPDLFADMLLYDPHGDHGNRLLSSEEVACPWTVSRPDSGDPVNLARLYLGQALRCLVLTASDPRSLMGPPWAADTDSLRGEFTDIFTPDMADRLNMQETWEATLKGAAAILKAERRRLSARIPKTCPWSLDDVLSDAFIFGRVIGALSSNRHLRALPDGWRDEFIHSVAPRMKDRGELTPELEREFGHIESWDDVIGHVAKAERRMLIAESALAEAAVTGKVPTISELAARSGAGKATVARALQERHIHPKRDVLIAKLRPNVRRVLDLLLSCMPTNSQRVFPVDEIAAGIFGEPPSENSRRANRKRFKDAVSELSDLGYHGHVENGLMAIRHGRRFKDGEGSHAVGLVLEGRSDLHHLPSPSELALLDLVEAGAREQAA